MMFIYYRLSDVLQDFDLRFGKGSSSTTNHLLFRPACPPATFPLITGAIPRCVAIYKSL